MGRRRAVITAGGTREAIDDVRVVANLSTGRFGAALARALHARGVDVTVIGSTTLCDRRDLLPPGIRRVPFTSAENLATQLFDAVSTPPDLLLMAAAVSDFTPDRQQGKIRSRGGELTVTLRPTAKILAELRARTGPDTTLVGFKLLSGVDATTLVDVARAQLRDHGLDAVVANDLSELGGGDHPVWLVREDRDARVEGPRDHVAEALVARLWTDHPAQGAPGRRLDLPGRARSRVWRALPHALGLPTHAGGGSPEHAVAAALAARRTTPWHPLAVGSEEGAILGHGEEDDAVLATRWRAIATPDARPLVHDGVVVAAVSPTDDAWRVVPTGLGDDDVWPQAVGPTLGDRPWRVNQPDDPAWAVRGFLRDGPLLSPPWRRADTADAASACLVDRAGRRVLVGVRGTAPARGGIAFPGGRPAGDPSLEATARRELHEETGLRAPPGPPMMVQTVWRGDAPTWAVRCHVWAVPHAEHPTDTPEFAARWRTLDDVGADEATLPGVHAVLAHLRNRHLDV